MVGEEELPGEVEEVGERGGQEAEGRYVCDECGATFQSQQALAAHKRRHKRERSESEVGLTQPSGEGELEVPVPPEVETIEQAIGFIAERLSKVYGIERYDRMIVSALRDDPTPLRDPSLLHHFIKSLAPRAYDTHLMTVVIKPLYTKYPNLPQAVDKYLGELSQPPPPMYGYYGYAYQYYQPYYSPYPRPYVPYAPPAYQYYYHYVHPPRPPRVYKVVVDGQEIETDEAGLLAWQRYLREREEHEMRRRQFELEMKKLEAEIVKITEEARRLGEQTVPVKFGDKEVAVPVSLAPLYMLMLGEGSRKVEELERKFEAEREARHKAEMEVLRREIDELKRRPSLLDELQFIEAIAHRLGYFRGGKTVIDVLDQLREDIGRTAREIVQRLPVSARQEWVPEITRTPEERARKAEEVIKSLEKTEKVLEVEDKLLKLASKLGLGGSK